jgi:hypothetical protein
MKLKVGRLPMASWFEPLWHYIMSPVGSTDIIGIVTALAFVTSFITYILTTVITRKVYIRLQRRALVDVFILFLSLALSITELIEPITILGVPNFILKLSLVIWIVGLIILIWLVWDVLSVDRATFKKPRISPPFKPFQVINQDHKVVQSFGIECVDDQLRVATDNSKPLYFPILLVAEKYFRPWRMAARFAVAGLAFESDENGNVGVKEGIIYFAFNQPAKIVLGQLVKRIGMVNPKAPSDYKETLNGKVPKKFEQVVVIDCHSKWLEKQSFQSHKKEFPEGPDQVHVLFSDPRDPYDLAKKYKRAVKILLNMGIERVRVVYDSISDFLVYSDPQLALQFIKHNMVWEDETKISSLYVYIPGVPKSAENNPVDEVFLRWNSYCVVEFKHEDPKLDTMILEGLLDEKIHRKVECTAEADYKTV